MAELDLYETLRQGEKYQKDILPTQINCVGEPRPQSFALFAAYAGQLPSEHDRHKGDN